MNQFTKNVALEWAKDNIRANAVAPGPVKTLLLENAMVCHLVMFVYTHSRYILIDKILVG